MPPAADTPLAIGIDIGTSGVRAVAMRPDFSIAARSAVPLERFGRNARDPAIWWSAVDAALTELLPGIDRSAVRSIAVDGTSGTLLPVDGAGRPLAGPLMYNDTVADHDILAAIAREASATSAALGATSGLAKALWFQRTPGVAAVLHQADWIAGKFSGRFDVSDENNALKTGYDVVARCWPDWIAATGMRAELLPGVVRPGDVVGRLTADAAGMFGLPREIAVVAGTTDGCASFLATGADTVGDAVTALGSTLTLKVLSASPIFDPKAGIYSHRLGDRWLAGGASNTGGAVLAAHFSAERMRDLEDRLDPDRETGLDYYPLLRPGERFPIADAALPPRLDPRPDDDALFFQGLLEGIARVEALGYRRLAELGGPAIRRVLTVGGGARNEAWTRIRRRLLGTEIVAALSEDAAVGTARLARMGLERTG